MALQAGGVEYALTLGILIGILISGQCTKGESRIHEVLECAWFPVPLAGAAERVGRRI